MGLARDLVRLEAVLRGHLGVDLFASIQRGGLLASPEAAAVLPRLAGLVEPAAVMRLCLQALHIQSEEIRPSLFTAELVATLPAEVPGIARPTVSVLREMLAPGIKEVILLGYEFTDQQTLELLAEVAAAGAKVFMICDRAKGAAARILDGWPSGTCRPRVFHDKKRTDGAPYASMHAKCLLVDSKDLLITSANFTFHGLHGNIEIGVRLGGAPAAEARKIFSHLVENKIVEELA